jgi:hypothetical protein
MRQFFLLFTQQVFFSLVVLASFLISMSTAYASTEIVSYSTEVTIAQGSEYVLGPVDVSTFSDLRLSFEYMAEELDRGDYFEYGWTGDEDEILGKFDGVSEGASALPDDETGTIVIALPDAAARSALRLFFRVTANASAASDFVKIANVTLTGIPVVIDIDGDGITEGDFCPNTTTDTAGNTKLNPNHWQYNGYYWIKGVTKNGRSSTAAYTMVDTRGCSCDQVITWLEQKTGNSYGGQSKFGCTAGTLEEFMSYAW